MHKIDTNGDGMVSKDEWLAFHEKVFAMLDTRKTGKVDARQFISHGGGDITGFSTGGYARGLRTEAMMHKIDTDGDGTVSHDEYIAYQTRMFDMMDTSTAHKGMLGKEEMLATGGGNRKQLIEIDNRKRRRSSDSPPPGNQGRGVRMSSSSAGPFPDAPGVDSAARRGS